MKKITVFIFCLMALYTQAQNTFPVTGNVGIGTTTPNFLLDVNGTARISNYWYFQYSNELNAAGKLYLNYRSPINGKVDSAYHTIINANAGNVGIGTTDPRTKLDVNGTARISNYWYFQNTNELNTAGNLYLNYRDPITGNGSLYHTIINANAGNVGIGTINPTHKLSVNGTIRAKEILVNAGWSDFVFDSNYKLRSLTEVEKFVKTNKHLPEIPSQQEVEKNGVQLGDISSKLLMKIEELTLYMIELKKENKTINEKIELLEKENALLKKSNSTH